MAAEALKAAIVALEKRDYARALAPLLEVWNQTRSPWIADLIDRATARFSRSFVAGGANLEGLHSKWLELAAARDPADVPRLLAALPRGTIDQAIARLAILAGLVPDPRIARGLSRLLEAQPYGEPFASKAVALVAALASDDRLPFDAEERELATVLDRLLDGLGDELLAAVHADLADDVPRAVYADWLLLQGDLHGELINIQLAGTLPAREVVLLGRLERKLIGALIWNVTRAPRLIERGFLEGVIIAKASARALAAATAAPEWLTVREIELESHVPPEWFGASNLRNVRRIRGASAALVRYLACDRTPALDLDVLGFDADSSLLASFVQDPGRLTGLRTLAVEGIAVPIAGIATSPLRLARLEVATMLSHIGRWLTSIETTTITELVITNDPKITCVRVLGAAWTIAIPLVDWTPALAGNLAAGLAGIDARVTIAIHDERYLTHVREALAPLGSRVRYA